MWIKNSLLQPPQNQLHNVKQNILQDSKSDDFYCSKIDPTDKRN